eukprot:NODE_1999_length_2314_cov_10.586648.p1 GENE.NODE_1999_length_2314_cov_10.586648~~NODE_1999_length_2314_cov_10.586648.p1  ORF type:complete len:625 (-),score=137.58 NODE_1999_length_2314_cov_10.586648:329-2203(-)
MMNTRLASLLRELTAEVEVVIHTNADLKQALLLAESELSKGLMQGWMPATESNEMKMEERALPAGAAPRVLQAPDGSLNVVPLVLMSPPDQPNSFIELSMQSESGCMPGTESNVTFLPAGAAPQVVQATMAMEERALDGLLNAVPHIPTSPPDLLEQTRASEMTHMSEVTLEASRDEIANTTTQRILDHLGPGLLVGQSLRRPSIHRSMLVFFDRGPLGRHVAASLKSFVRSPLFEMSFAFLIVGNAITMAFEIQYQSFDLAHNLAYNSNTRSSQNTWPVAEAALNMIGIVFGICFTVEVVLKSVVLRREFFKIWWNIFDTILVILWILDILVDGNIGMNPTLLRVFRLFRLVRLSRMVKTLQALDSLQVLVGSIAACTSVLLWSAIVLGFIFTIMSMGMNALLTPYMEPDGEGDISLATRQSLFTYFGSYTRSMYTMFELTTGNFVPVTRLLTENVGEGYGAFLFIYRFIVGFAVVKVITGVFMHETFRVAASDDDLMVVQKLRTMQKHAKKMNRLLDCLDQSHDGNISREEFLSLLKHKNLKMWLASMDIEVDNLNVLFEVLANGDDDITKDELVKGISRLRGPARSIDLVAVAARCEDLRDRIMRIDDKVVAADVVLTKRI